MTDPPGPPQLGDISTHWSGVRDPGQFAMRYATAVRAYLVRLLPDPNDADDVAQEFFLEVARHGFARATADRGRFRNYLIVSVRNAARRHLQQKGRPAARTVALPDHIPTADPTDLSDWRRCLLDRVMRRLHLQERQSPGNLSHTVLVIRAEYPQEDSAAQAARVAERAGRPLTAGAYRKQVSRALRAFAWLVVCEVAETVEPPTADAVDDELRETGLFAQVADYLPADWRTRPLTAAGGEPDGC